MLLLLHEARYKMNVPTMSSIWVDCNASWGISFEQVVSYKSAADSCLL